MRIAVIKKERCKGGVDCDYLCKKFCPKVRAKEDAVVIGEDNKPVINELICIGCGICVKKCPFNAISIVNIPEKIEKKVIHRYGVNGFLLCRFAIPRFGKVIGILGRNGIGKTTMLNILNGKLRPNFGNVGYEPSEKEILNFFKGSETQNYFKKLLEKEIKVSIKPQHIDKIAVLKCKVIDFLKDFDNLEEINKISDSLNIKEILDHEMNKLSGGELQRIAIAACLLKNANVFFFDEPSSYLDIKQRLNMCKVIRNKSNEENCIFVVEHDLIALDYLCDLIHIMFGEEGVYGIASNLFSSKEGINSFLDGYLRDENIRFREAPIRFEAKPPLKASEGIVSIEWPKIEKKMDGFKLVVNPGKIFVNEIIGIIGENGIGKTTFARILAGEITPDNCKLDLNVKISYKPQYIESKSDEKVGIVLSKINKNFMSDENKYLVIGFNAHHLLERKINELSGGELQSIAILSCFLRDADLYLLDEPSAHLDVEQRINTAKIIRDFAKKRNKNVMVIDHDLLFIDYLSERLLVFSGKPSIHGFCNGPFEMRQGMNLFLKEIGITFRRDESTKRPRPNKLNSVKDREQREKGEFYYT